MDASEINTVFTKLKLPAQDIKLLPFCGGTKPSHVSLWANSLKALQTNSTASQLYQAIPQVSRLMTSAPERKEMLDALFTVAYPCIFTLGKNFLNQPVDLPESAQKTALVSQSILNSLTVGYLVCLRDFIKERKAKTTYRRAISEVLYHGLQLQALMQLRTLQLYSQTPAVVWRQANSMMRIGRAFDLLDVVVKPLLSDQKMTTVLDIYCQMVALATAKTNQLSQIDIGHVFNALTHWGSKIKLATETATAWVDLDDQRSPALAARHPMPEGKNIISIEFRQLTPFLMKSAEIEDAPKNTVGAVMIPKEISTSTLAHLCEAWSEPGVRGSGRSAKFSELKVVVGFTPCHQVLSGIAELSAFVGSHRDESRTSGGMPSLSSLLGSLSLEDDSSSVGNLPSPFTATLQNSSPNGYGFAVDGAPSLKVDAGEVIIVQTPENNAWSIGIIRWIRRAKNQILFGVQKLCDKPEAVAASGNYDQGGYSDPMRAFLLAGLLSPGRSGLLTGNVLFKERTKVKLYRLSQEEAEFTVLGEMAMQTSKVSAFHLATALKVLEREAKKHTL